MPALCIAVTVYVAGAASLTAYICAKVRARPEARARLDADERAAFFAILGAAVILWPFVVTPIAVLAAWLGWRRRAREA